VVTVLESKTMSIKGLRIARVSTVPFFVVTQLSAQLRALNESGAEVHVIASDDDLRDALHAMQGVEFMPINIAREISPLSDLVSLVRLIVLFRKKRYDIVHSTTPKAGLLTAIAARVAGVKVRLHTFTGQPWVTMSGLKKQILIFCDKIIANLNTHNFTDSESQRAFLVREGLVSAKKISVIGAGSLAGVDLRRFDSARFSNTQNVELRQALEIPEDAKILLFVGRVTPDKGIRELMLAFSKLCTDQHNVFMVMVGPYEADGREIVESHLAAGHNDRIKIVGMQVEPEKYMAIADILCLPSYREGFGTVVIEAAAMGLPTVGTEIYGLTDAVVQGETGLLVPVGDAGALGEAIGLLLSNPERLAVMSSDARSRARREFDSARCSALLIEKYEGFHYGQ